MAVSRSQRRRSSFSALAPPRAERRGSVECLRREVAAALDEERALRAREIEELRSTVRSAATDDGLLRFLAGAPPTPLQVAAAKLGADGPPAVASAPPCSSERIAELQERMLRESAFLTKQLELQRVSLEDKLFRAQRAVEERLEALQLALEREDLARRGDIMELREVHEAACQAFAKADVDPMARAFCNEFQGQPTSGAADGVAALHDMVREALSESLGQRRELALEVNQRRQGEQGMDQKLNALGRRLDALQSVLRSVCLVGCRHGGPPSLEKLAAEEPRWAKALLHRESHDVPDAGHRRFLGDVMEIMESSCRDVAAALPKHDAELDAGSADSTDTLDWPVMPVCFRE